jgi:hypothetical protein
MSPLENSFLRHKSILRSGLKKYCSFEKTKSSREPVELESHIYGSSAAQGNFIDKKNSFYIGCANYTRS